jgi:hypothetical protein
MAPMTPSSDSPGDARAQFRRDVVATVVVTALYLLFVYQRGFNNTPDSWYRGVLAKTILEGHPFTINIKQGWFYDYGAWHHDSTHEPLLPLVYALVFLVTGLNITVSNVVAGLCAGITLFPLLRLSRRLVGSPLPAVCLFLVFVLNEKNDFLMEIRSGLSLPPTVCFLLLGIYALNRFTEQQSRGPLVMFALAMTAFYLTRADAQAVYLIMLATAPFLIRWLPIDLRRPVLKAWGLSFVLVLPWFLRKLVLFGNPIFRDVYPMIWTDRVYDYFDYHEQRPYPSAATYFQNHTFADYLYRVFITNPRSLVRALGDITPFPGWSYWAALLLSFWALRRTEGATRYLLSTVQLLTLAYLAIMTQSTITEPRHLLPLYLLLSGFLVFGGYAAIQRLPWPTALPAWSRSWAAPTYVVAYLVLGLAPFAQDLRTRHLTFTYETAGPRLERDRQSYRALRERFGTGPVILGPFAQVQRLGFATGLTLVEEPGNFRKIRDHGAFFRRYDIGHSLVNPVGIVDRRLIDGLELVGNELVFHLRAAPPSAVPPAGATAARPPAQARPKIFWDSYHGAPIDPGPWWETADIHAAKGPFDVESTELLSRTILVHKLALDAPPLRPGELAVLRQFVAGGGSILLACHGWLWIQRPGHLLGNLPCNQISQSVGIAVTMAAQQAPYRLDGALLGADDVTLTGRLSFSPVVALDGTALAQDTTKATVGVIQDTGRNRAIVFGHDQPLSAEFLRQPVHRAYLEAALRWLSAAAPP